LSTGIQQAASFSVCEDQNQQQLEREENHCFHQCCVVATIMAREYGHSLVMRLSDITVIPVGGFKSA
jgi:hypothetical protein